MTARRRQVHRLEAAAAFLVKNIEALHQADEIALLGMRAVAPATVEIHDVGRPADRRERRVTVAETDILVRVARAQAEARRRAREQRVEQVGVEADALRIGIDRAAGARVMLACIGRQHDQADVAQNPHPGEVNFVDLLRRQQLERRMPVLQRPPGWLL